MSQDENYGDTLFCQEIADEMYRLELVSKTYDFISQRQISTLITQPDMRCLDIGSGTGSMAKWLSEQPKVKEVVALDRFVNLLEKKLTISEKLHIVQHDLNSDDYTGEFDLINIRFVLMHLRDREKILNKISSWLKPSGWLIVSDVIDLSPEEVDDPLYRKIMSTMWQVLIDSIGTDKNWSHKLNLQFQYLGYRNITNEVYLPPISKDSPMAEFWCLTWRAMHDRLLEMSDLDERTLTDAENRLIQGEMVALSPGMMTCIGQK
ncbi:class I SAM-dependent methyltransferase [Yersinia massiliensis]|uniref:class I SAM-dependent methyltransferase n=2 Tax=Yersinia massiliensis TaxID=419257 RepID=UPI00031524C7|nr:class I SAM-dependent methyltransferase [Yersinia massiliensis]